MDKHLFCFSFVHVVVFVVKKSEFSALTGKLESS
jgi:hypothetical protein